MAGCNKSFQSSVFVLTQLHFGQWSSLPFCLPSLIVQWHARILAFSNCTWLWNWLKPHYCNVHVQYCTVMRGNILCSLYHEVFFLLDDWPCSGCNEPCCPVHTREKAVWTKNLGLSGQNKSKDLFCFCSLFPVTGIFPLILLFSIISSFSLSLFFFTFFIFSSAFHLFKAGFH